MTGFEAAILGLGASSFGANLFGQGNAAAASREANDFNKWAYQMSMQREDNAVQRRVNDLRAAGLSPTLAAGSAASSMGPISVNPNQTVDPSAAISAAIQPILAASQLRQTDAQVRLTNSQAQATQYDTLSKAWHDKLTEAFFPSEFRQRLANIAKTYADTGLTSAEASLRRTDVRKGQESGLRPGSALQDLADVLNLGKRDIGAQGGLLDSLMDIGVPGRRARKEVK